MDAFEARSCPSAPASKPGKLLFVFRCPGIRVSFVPGRAGPRWSRGVSPKNSVHRCCKPSAPPPALWAQKSGSALGGHTGPAAPSRRSTEARGQNTSCQRTPVARADAGEETGNGGLWAVYTGAWSPGTGELCPKQKGRPKDRGSVLGLPW